MRHAAEVILGLGSNLGERLAHLHGAVELLSRSGLTIRRVSSIYESLFVGPGAAQPRYLNLVLEVRTVLLPLELLRLTQEVERQHGRAPDSHLQPRPLDIDMLFYSGWIVRHPDLVVPHPRLHERRFVLEPLQEIGALRRRAGRKLERILMEVRRRQMLTWYCEAPSGGETHATTAS